MTEQSVIDRLVRSGDPDECWEWVGAHQANGYGQVNLLDGHWLAHRLVFKMTFGWLPEQVHHRCRNKGCVNPAHLEGLTLREHQNEHHVKERCVRGHDLTDPANVYQRPDGKGRMCRPCFADRMRERRARMTKEERRAEDRKRSERRRKARAASGR